MAIKRGSKVEVGFSASSMTDLIFLLLLFMMLSTTLINPNAVKLTLPKSSNQIKDKAATSVSITADLTYYLETEPIFRQVGGGSAGASARAGRPGHLAAYRRDGPVRRGHQGDEHRHAEQVQDICGYEARIEGI